MSRRLLLAIGVVVLLVAEVPAGMVVRFDRSALTVRPDEQFTIDVVIDGDSSTSELEPVSSGLFSFGIRVKFDRVDATVASKTSLVVAEPLDFFGFSSGSLQEFGDDFAAVRGNVQVGQPTYKGTLLASLELQNRASAGSSYTLSLEEFRTLGPTEDIFVNGLSQSLDDDLVFTTAEINVSLTAGPCDFDGNGAFGLGDLDLLHDAVVAGRNEERFDVTLDGLVDVSDIVEFVERPDKLNTFIGDSDLDGEFNSSDLIIVFAYGEYEDSVALNSTWRRGDWDGNGDFETGDLLLAFQRGGYELGTRQSRVIAVPEPHALTAILVCLLVFMYPRFRT